MFGPDELVVVPPGDAEALASAVRELLDAAASRERFATAGHIAYSERFSEAKLAGLFCERLASDAFARR